MFRYRLSTLMIVLAIGPLALALLWDYWQPLAIFAAMTVFIVLPPMAFAGLVVFTLHAVKPLFDAISKRDGNSAVPRDRPT